MKPLSKTLLVVLCSVVGASSLVGIGFASWAVTQKGGSGSMDISADADVFDLNGTIAFSSFTCPKIGKYFFEDEDSKTHSATGEFTFTFSLSNPSEATVNSLSCDLSYSNPGSDDIVTSTLIDSIAVIQGNKSTDVSSPTYESKTCTFAIPQGSVATSGSSFKIVFRYKHALVYSHRSTILNGGFFKATLYVGGAS